MQFPKEMWEITKKMLMNSGTRSAPGGFWGGFSNFGDSNIDFFIFLQAVDRSGTFKVKSELIKRIHTRFTAENIEINYPVRKLLIPESEIPSNISEVIADN